MFLQKYILDPPKENAKSISGDSTQNISLDQKIQPSVKGTQRQTGTDFHIHIY